MSTLRKSGALAVVLLVCAALRAQPSSQLPSPNEGDYIIHDFHFKSGEALPELRLHYATFRSPTRDARGRVTNAVMLLHGTSGSGARLWRRKNRTAKTTNTANKTSI
jgi:homoserine O-acetyltransferase/O-succinyltransferase